MIVCEYADLRKYQSMLPELDHALTCVEELRKKDFPDGRHEFEGGFLFVQRGTTKPFAADAYETHQKYIDLQYMVQGREEAYYAPVSELVEKKPYDEEADIAFYEKTDGKGSLLRIRGGMCYIVYPEDGHMPCRHEQEATEYLKLVIKLPCE